MVINLGKRNIYSYSLILLISFCFYKFYKYVGINMSIRNYFIFLGFFMNLVLAYEFFITKYNSSRYGSIIRWIFYIYFFSIIMSFAFWKQNLFQGFRATIDDLFILFFFSLYNNKVSKKQIEKIVLILLIVYVLIWLYSVSQIPKLVFGIDRDNNLARMDRGFYRLFIPGINILPFGFFYFLNKFKLTKKIIWIALSAIIFSIIVLHVRRQLIVWTALVGIIYFVFKFKHSWFYILVAAFVLLIIPNLVTLSNDSVLGKLFNKTERQISSSQSGHDDIRIKAIRFFTTEYSRGPLTNVFGNGKSWSESNFGKYNLKVNQKGYFKSDIGWFGLYADFGIVGVILYLILLIKVLKQNVSENVMYAKLYFINLNLTFLLSHSLTSSVILLCISLYIMELDNNKTFTITSYNSESFKSI